MNARQLFQPVKHMLQLFFIVHIEFYTAREQAFLGLNSEGCDIDLQFTGDQIGDFIDHTHIIQSNNIDPCEKGDLLVLRPLRLYYPVAVLRQKTGCIRAVGSMNDESLAR